MAKKKVVSKKVVSKKVVNKVTVHLTKREAEAVYDVLSKESVTACDARDFDEPIAPSRLERVAEVMTVAKLLSERLDALE